MLTSDHELPECIYEPNQPTMIFPKNSTPKETLHLSNLDDQKFLRFSIKYLYVFGKSINTKSLKESLSRVLVEYYPLAGRLRKRIEDDEDSKLEIECNGKGAVFAEAKMDLRGEDFLRYYAAKPNRNSLRKLLYRVDAPAGFLDIPPLVIQVTNLSCGGMIMCTAINHCVCDGIGTSQFLHAWAHMCRSNGSTPSTPHPIHNRHVLNPRTPSRASFPHPVFTGESLSGPNIFEYLQSQRLSPASITFTPSQITLLKRQCASLKCTAFEVLASHTWRCWVKSLALTLPLTPPVPVKLIFSTSIRGKLASPKVPIGYYGNAFVMACVEANANELLVAPNLRDPVKLIRRAKSLVTSEDYVHSMIDLMEEDKTLRTDLSTTLVISQWSKLGLDEVDFGRGKPVHVGPLSSDVYCLFLPVVGESDAVRVLVSMPESVVGKFEYYMKEVVHEGEDAKNHPYGVDTFKMVSAV